LDGLGAFGFDGFSGLAGASDPGANEEVSTDNSVTMASFNVDSETGAGAIDVGAKVSISTGALVDGLIGTSGLIGASDTIGASGLIDASGMIGASEEMIGISLDGLNGTSLGTFGLIGAKLLVSTNFAVDVDSASRTVVSNAATDGVGNLVCLSFSSYVVVSNAATDGEMDNTVV